MKKLLPVIKNSKNTEKFVRWKAEEMINEAERKKKLITVHGRTNETIEESLKINSLLVDAVKAKLSILEHLDDY
jgi:hypothetical protein